MKRAIQWYKNSCDSQDEWPQLHHVCYWELIWSNQFNQDWWEAYHYASFLFEGTLVEKSFHTKASVWSKTNLNPGCVGGTWVDPPSCKMNTFFLRSLALSMPI